VPGYTHHIFVCENVRPDGHARGCCSAKGSAAIRARFKALVREHGLEGRVRANMAGCLDACESGPTVVVYPEAVWYAGVRVEDCDEIFTRHILNGEVVERLLLPRPDAGVDAGA
jgi:(2Fe-2S) ferredoxin